LSAHPDLFPLERSRAEVSNISPPFKVGRTFWRCVVQHNPEASAAWRFTWSAEWRDGMGDWRTQREWRTYNINNGMTLGLPKGLGRPCAAFCARYADYMAVPADVRARVDARIAEHLAAT